MFAVSIIKKKPRPLDEVLWVYAEVYFWDNSKNEKNILGFHTDIDSILKSMKTENKKKIKIRDRSSVG